MLVAKADAGAEFAVTQMFFRASDYFELVERVRARGVDIPILPGIMPILNLNADPPDGRADRHRRARRGGRRGSRPTTVTRPAYAPRASRSPPSCARSCSAGGAPGLHFYTLNRSKATLEIFAALNIDGLTPRLAFEGCAPSPSPGPAPQPQVPDTAVVRLAAVHRARTLAEALAGAESAARRWSTAAGADLVVSTVNLSRVAHQRRRARAPGSRRGTP